MDAQKDKEIDDKISEILDKFNKMDFPPDTTREKVTYNLMRHCIVEGIIIGLERGKRIINGE